MMLRCIVLVGLKPKIMLRSLNKVHFNLKIYIKLEDLLITKLDFHFQNTTFGLFSWSWLLICV
jgi:hypothetical protein